MCLNVKNHSANDRARGSWVSGSSACWGPVRQLFTSKQMRCHLLQVSVAIHSLAHRKKKGFLWKEGLGLLLPLQARGREGRALLHSFAPRQMRSKIPAPGHTCCASSLPSCCCCCPNRSLQVVSGAPQVSGAASAAHSHQAMGFPPRAPHRPWYSAACGHCHLQRCAWPPRHCPPCPLHPGRGGRAAGSDQRGGGRPGAAALPVSKHTSNP